MATTSNYSWTTPDDTDLVKDGASAIRTLGSAIDTTVFNNAGAAVAKSTVDAKGDLIVGTANDTVGRLAVGTDGYTLVADSSTATGLAYAAPAGGGDYVKLAASSFSAVGSHSVNSVFSATYKFYRIFIEWDAATVTGEVSIRLRTGGVDANTNYGATRIINYGATLSSDSNGGLGTDEMWIAYVHTTHPTKSASEITIGTPFDATATTFSTRNPAFDGTNYFSFFCQGNHSTATSYDSFTIIAASGDLTGTAYVYGVKA